MIDLHVHTKITDSSFSVKEVITQAKARGIRYLAITDHDTMKGLNEAIEYGNELGVDIIPGIEISAFDYKRNKRAHILGLYIEPEHPALEKLCAPVIEGRNQASYEMVKRIMAEGYKISWKDVQKYTDGGTGVFKQHIMHALMDQGYCKSIYGELYKKLFRRGSSTEHQGFAYIPLEYVDATAAIQAIREAGGIAVLAHPGQLDNYDSIEEWVQLGLEGIEVFHPSHSQEDIRTSSQYAQKYNLVITGGSDYHGFYGEYPVELGCLDLDDSNIQELIKRRQIGLSPC